jgi:F-type H+-transporting ATPase subunit a
MAARLFGNILAGEILLIVLNKLTPWIIPDLMDWLQPYYWFLAGIYFHHVDYRCSGPCF